MEKGILKSFSASKILNLAWERPLGSSAVRPERSQTSSLWVFRKNRLYSSPFYTGNCITQYREENLAKGTKEGHFHTRAEVSCSLPNCSLTPSPKVVRISSVTRV